MAKTALADVALWCGVFAIVTRGCDFLLSAAQKKKLQLCFEAAWYRLEENRAGKFLQPLQAARLMTVLPIAFTFVGVVAAARFAVLAYQPHTWGLPSGPFIEDTYSEFVFCLSVALWFVLLMYPAVRIVPRVAEWLAGGGTAGSFFHRVAELIVYGMLLASIPIFFWIALSELSVPAAKGYRAVLAAAAAAAFVAYAYHGLITLVALGSVVWLAVALSVRMILAILKVSVLWLASHPSGPVIAAGALLAALSALAKFSAR